MVEFLEIILPIIGAGIVGYIIRWIEEKRRRTHEREVGYQSELKKHLPNLIQPLFKLLGDLWYSLIGLTDWDQVSEDMVTVKGRKLTIAVSEVETSVTALKNFVENNESEVDLLLPHPLQSWQYVRLQNNVSQIINEARSGKNPIGDITNAISAVMDMQSDLQKIVGFETKMRLRSEHAFEKPLSRFEKLKRKIKRP